MNKNKTLNFVYLRYFQVYGEGEKLPRLWAQLRYNAKNDLNFTVENGSLVRDFISVDQVCKKTIYFFDRYKKEGLFLKNVGNQKGVKISDFAKKWWKVFEGKKKLIIKNKKTEHIKYLISKN